jgi:hypothetical protein
VWIAKGPFGIMSEPNKLKPKDVHFCHQLQDERKHQGYQGAGNSKEEANHHLVKIYLRFQLSWAPVYLLQTKWKWRIKKWKVIPAQGAKFQSHGVSHLSIHSVFRRTLIQPPVYRRLRFFPLVL